MEIWQSAGICHVKPNLLDLLPGKVHLKEFALILEIFTDLALSVTFFTDGDFTRSSNRSKSLGNVGSWVI